MKYGKLCLLAAAMALAPSLGYAAPGDDAARASATANAEANRLMSQSREVQSYYREGQQRTAYGPAEEAVTVAPAEKVAEEESPSFYVKEIRVTRSELLSDDELLRAVHFPGAGEMSLEDLSAVTARINALYQEKGILTARAVLPPQEIHDGVVRIRLIEGRFGDTYIEGNHRVKDEAILHRMTIKKGELTDLKKLEADLRNYNSTSTWQLRAEIVPGKTEGSSDVKLTLAEPENPVTAFFYTDNAGTKSSGRYRLGAYAELRGINGHDDAIGIAPIWSHGTLGGSLFYDTPLGHRGTRMTVGYSHNDVDIVSGRFKDLIDSRSNDLYVALSHPLNITPYTKIDLFGELHKKWSDTDYAGSQMIDNDTRTVKVGVNVRKFDENGLWFAQAAVTGYKFKDNIYSEEEGGSYYSAYLLRKQDLPKDRYLLYRLYGQYTAFNELPSTESFSIGGASTVRGYEESLLSGDSGWYTGLEYNIPLSSDHKTWRGGIFLDHGVIYNNYASGKTKDFLTSAGVSFEYARSGWYGKVALGVPLNDSGSVGSQHPRIHFYLQRNV